MKVKRYLLLKLFGINGICKESVSTVKNIILVNKESGWWLERQFLRALAVGFGSLHPYGNLY